MKSEQVSVLLHDYWIIIDTLLVLLLLLLLSLLPRVNVLTYYMHTISATGEFDRFKNKHKFTNTIREVLIEVLYDVFSNYAHQDNTKLNGANVFYSFVF